MGVLGPIAANAGDLAIGYSLISGPDPLDPQSTSQPPVTLTDTISSNSNFTLFSSSLNSDSLKGLRIGIYTPNFNHANKEIVETCRNHLKLFEKHGAELVEVELEELEEARVAHLLTS